MTAQAGERSEATSSEEALRLLQRDIVLGSLKPDSKLKIRVLKERYGIGSSPMREALAQLSAQGLVNQYSQRGFRVPPLSAAHLADITRSRQLVEVEAVEADRVSEDVARRRRAGVQQRPLVERRPHVRAPRNAAARSPAARPSSWKPKPW